MKHLVFIIVFFFISCNLYSQVNPSQWDKLKVIGTEFYEFQIPDNWKEMPPTDNKELEKYFDGSGFALPQKFNNSPVIVTVYVVAKDADDLEEAKDKCLNGYRGNPDKEFPEDFTDGSRKIKLADGTDAYLLNTRFYRQTRKLNQSQFDLVVYSKKADKSYIYTLSIQYNDLDYEFESKNKLPDFASKLFSYFKLKS